jgi:glucokinase
MLLAGDIGGTKTLLGLFRAGAVRPEAVHVDEFVTLDFSGLEPMVRKFLQSQDIEPPAIEAACFGVAGAVTDQVARLTNVPWRIDCAAARTALGFERVWVLNDLEALAYGIGVLQPDELAQLHPGRPSRRGNAAVIAAGTGLGEAVLLNVDGRFVPGASEGGHADFAARTTRELDLVRDLTRLFGRVSVEHILSGPGIVNIYQFTHQAFGTGPKLTPHSIAPSHLCEAVGDVEDVADLPARITAAARENRCERCTEAIAMFVSAYGAEAGNIALRAVATAGVYIGGGIAPKLLPVLQGGSFMEAFLAKAPMDDLVAGIPVSVILNPDAGLLGAAAHAQYLTRTP